MSSSGESAGIHDPSAPRRDLGHDDEIVRIGVQRLADQLVCDVGAIVIAGVDMVYAQGDRCAQHGQRRVTIFGRAKHAGAGELHGAIAQPLHHAVAERERARLIRCGHGRSPLETIQARRCPRVP
jgi:hypothetical protein